MEQWTGPDSTLGANFPGVFSPHDKTKLTERFARLRDAVSQLRGADVFVFLPGDPGGDPEGRLTLKDCLSFSRHVQAIVKQQAHATAQNVQLSDMIHLYYMQSPTVSRQ